MQYDKRTTSQRVTDEMSAMREEIRWYRKWLKKIDIQGPITEEDAYDMRRWARLAIDMYKDRGERELKTNGSDQRNNRIFDIKGL
jgi:hypothetical protein